MPANPSQPPATSGVTATPVPPSPNEGGGSPYQIRPIVRDQAFDFIDTHHRHHPKPQGWLWGTSVIDETGEVVGVIAVGRPGARKKQDGLTCEATRVCVLEGLPRVNGHANSLCSQLYARAWRAAREIGFQRMRTLLMADEPATTLKALAQQGWKFVGMTDGRSWNVPSRPRIDKHPLGPKQVWEVMTDEYARKSRVA